MRIFAGVVLAGMGVVILGGPAFGAVGLLTGHQVTAQGGVVRVLLDPAVGTSLSYAGWRRLQIRPRACE